MCDGVVALHRLLQTLPDNGRHALSHFPDGVDDCVLHEGCQTLYHDCNRRGKLDAAHQRRLHLLKQHIMMLMRR